jgi:hypothetical protein
MFTDSVLAHGAGVAALVALAALVFKLVQRRHSPYSRQDWMVVGALAAYGIEWAIIVPGISGICVAVAGPLAPPAINLMALFVREYCVAGFLLLATEARRGLRWMSVAFVLATAGLLVLIGLGALDRPPGSLPASPAAVVLNAWIASYATAAALVAITMAWRYSKQTRQPVTTALRMIAYSKTVGTISANISAGISTNLAWLGHPLPAWIPYWAKNVNNLAMAGFLAGACLPAVLGWLTTVRRGWTRHRIYRDLETLWALLNEAFPRNTLHRAPKPDLAERLAWHSPNRRYYRRAVECRDGLVQISPYLHDDAGSDPDHQARALRTALRERAIGAAAHGEVQVFAPPAAPDIDSDAAALRALSRALSRLATHQN